MRQEEQQELMEGLRCSILFETLEFSHWKAVEDIAEIELRRRPSRKLKNMKIMF